MYTQHEYKCDNKIPVLNHLIIMAEGGVPQTSLTDSDEDGGLQELEKELEKIRDEIRAARRKQDRQQTLRRQIEEAKKELAAITGDTRGINGLFFYCKGGNFNIRA